MADKAYRIFSGNPSDGEGASLTDDSDRYGLKVGHVEKRAQGFLVADASEDQFSYIDNPYEEPQVLVTYEYDPKDILKKGGDEITVKQAKVIKVKILRPEPEMAESVSEAYILASLCERLTFDQLFNSSDPKRILRSKTVRGPALDLDAHQDSLFYYFNYKSYPSTTGLRHKGYMQFFKPRGLISPDDRRPLETVECLADCTCPDYRYRWAWANKQRGSAKVGPQSLNQAQNRAPRKTNPQSNVGLCKHLLAMRDFIYGQTSNFPDTDLTNDRLDKLTKFATKRWINMPQEMAKAKARERAYRDLTQARRQGDVPPEDNKPAPGEAPLRDVVPDEILPDVPDAPDDLPPEEPDVPAPPEDTTEPPPAAAPLPQDAIRNPAAPERLSRIPVPTPPEIGQEPGITAPAAPVPGTPRPSFFSRLMEPIRRALRRFRRPRNENLSTHKTNRVFTPMKEITEAQKLVEEMEADLAPAAPGADIDIADAPADQGDEAISLLRDIRDQLVQLNGGDEDMDDDDTDEEGDDEEVPELDDDDDVPVEDPDSAPVAPMA